MDKAVLERIMELKRIERQAKEERVTLEEQLYQAYKPLLVKKSNTFRDGDFKITINLNEKVRLKKGELPPLGADVYTEKIDEKKLLAYVGQPWVEQYSNSPTITVVKE